MKRLMSKDVCVVAVAVAVAVVKVSLDDLSPPASPFSPSRSRWRSSAPFPPDLQGFEPATTCRRPDIFFAFFCSFLLDGANDDEMQSDEERLALFKIKLCFISNAMFSALWCFSLICEHSVLPPVIHGREHHHVPFQATSNRIKTWVASSSFRCFSTVQSSDTNINGAQSCTQGGRNRVNAAASLYLKGH